MVNRFDSFSDGNSDGVLFFASFREGEEVVNCRTATVEGLNEFAIDEGRNGKSERVVVWEGGRGWRKHVRRRGNRGGGMVLLMVVGTLHC